MPVQIQRPPRSILVGQVNALQATDRFARLDNIGRLELLTDYEQKLFERIEEDYKGGWDRYLKDNPESAQYLEDAKKEVYKNASEDIEASVPSFWEMVDPFKKEVLYGALGGSLLGPAGAAGGALIGLLGTSDTRSPVEATIGKLGMGLKLGGSYWAKLLGFDDLAEEWEKDAMLIDRSLEQAWNRIAEKAMELDDTTAPFIDEVYTGLRTFLPFLEPDDKQILKALAEREGPMDFVAKVFGHVGRIKTIMHFLPFKGLSIPGAYAASYATATSLADTLSTPTAQNTFGRQSMIAGTTFAALFAGGQLSRWAMKNPMLASALTKLPVIAQDFAAARLSDIGETLANTATLAIQTGNPWDVMKAMPAAMIANFAEEIIADMVGLPSAKGTIVQAQVYNLRRIEEGMTKRIESIQAAENISAEKKKNDIAKLTKSRDVVRAAYGRRVDGYKKHLKANSTLVQDSINRNPEVYRGHIEVNKAKGMTDEEAKLEAAGDTHIGETSFQAAVDERLDMGIKTKVDKLKDHTKKLIGKIRKGEEIVEGFEPERGEFVLEEEPGEEPLIAAAETMAEEAIAEERPPVEEVRPAIRPKKPVRPGLATVTGKIIEEHGGLSEKVIQDLGYNVQDIKESVHQPKRMVRKTGGIQSEADLEQIHDDLLEAGLIANFRDPATEKVDSSEFFPALLDILRRERQQIDRGEAPQTLVEPGVELTESESAEQINSAVKSGDINEDEANEAWNAHREQFGLEGKDDEWYDVLSTGTNMEPGGVLAMREWIRSLPQDLRNFIGFNLSGELAVNVDRYEKIYKRKYDGRRILGKVALVNGRYFVDMVYDAPISTAHHEAFHIAQLLALSNNDISALFNQIGPIEDQAKAYSDFLLKSQTDTTLKRIFNKIKNFFNRMRNLFDRRGFRSIEDIFREVSEGKLQFNERALAIQEFYQDNPPRGYLTKEGFKQFLKDPKEYKGVASKGWVVVARPQINRVNYKALKLDKDTVDLVEADLNRHPINAYSDKTITLHTSKAKYIIRASDYDRNNRDLVATLDDALMADEIDQGVEEFYNVEEKEDLDIVANKAGSSKGFWNMVERHPTMKKAIQSVPGLADVFEHYTKQNKDMRWIATQLELPFFAAKNWPQVKAIMDRQFQREEDRAKVVEEFNRILEPYRILSPESKISLNAILIDLDLKQEEFTDFNDPKFKAYLKKAKREMSEVEFDAYIATRQALDRVLDLEIQEINDFKDDMTTNFFEKRFGSVEEYLALLEGDEEEQFTFSKFLASRRSKREKGRPKTMEEFLAADPDMQEATMHAFLRRTYGRYNKSIEQLERQARTIEGWRGKGYFPHTWNGKFRIDFLWEVKKRPTETAAQFNARRKAWLNAIKKIEVLQADPGRWSNELKDTNSETKVGFTFDKFEDYEIAKAELNKANMQFATSKARKNFNVFEFAKRSEVRSITDEIIAASREAAEKKGQDVDAQMEVEENYIEAAIDLIRHERDVLEKIPGWNKHTLERKWKLGFETMEVEAVLADYLTGYAGIVTKRKTANDMYRILSDIDPKKQPNLRQYADNFVNHLLRNQDVFDKINSYITSTVFAKHLGFNFVFHIRNRWQPWYFGFPVMTSHNIPKKVAVEQLARAQRDIAFLERFYLTGRPTRDKAEDFKNNIKNITSEEGRAIVQYIASGELEGLQSEMLSLVKQFEKTNKAKTWFGRGYEKGLDVVSRFVASSDGKNRIQMFLASYRALSMDKKPNNEDGYNQEAFDEAVEISRETNVVYKGWNTAPIFWGHSPLRLVKPLFQFQKYNWHTTRQALEFVTKGHAGSYLQYLMITALLGGTSTLPFWDKLKKMLGIEASMDVRGRMIRALGGKGAVIDLLEYGAFGMAGIDISTSLKIRHLSMADPIFGENALWSLFREANRTAADIRRGRLWKGIVEGVWSPGFMIKMSRALREGLVEGKTTVRGDVVVDAAGKPFHTTPYEIAMGMMGFMPKRLGKHYAAQGAVRELMGYWGQEKSDIGTRYKIARIRKDSAMMSEVKREIKVFNDEIGGYKTTPVPVITDRTLKAWARHAGTERERSLKNEYWR